MGKFPLFSPLPGWGQGNLFPFFFEKFPPFLFPFFAALRARMGPFFFLSTREPPPYLISREGFAFPLFLQRAAKACDEASFFFFPPPFFLLRALRSPKSYPFILPSCVAGPSKRACDPGYIFTPFRGDSSPRAPRNPSPLFFFSPPNVLRVGGFGGIFFFSPFALRPPQTHRVSFFSPFVFEIAERLGLSIGFFLPLAMLLGTQISLLSFGVIPLSAVALGKI